MEDGGVAIRAVGWQFEGNPTDLIELCRAGLYALEEHARRALAATEAKCVVNSVLNPASPVATPESAKPGLSASSCPILKTARAFTGIETAQRLDAKNRVPRQR